MYSDIQLKAISQRGPIISVDTLALQESYNKIKTNY